MIRRVFVVGLATLALAACGSTSSTQQPVVTLPAPLSLDVAKIEVVSDFHSSQQPPHVEKRFPVTPEEAMRDWAKTHLIAAGHSGVARFVITDASVMKVDLTKNAGLPGVPRAPQTILYNARCAAVLDILNAQGARVGHASANFEFSRTIWPDASPQAHKQLFEGMIAPLIKGFGAVMTTSMRNHIAAYME